MYADELMIGDWAHDTRTPSNAKVVGLTNKGNIQFRTVDGKIVNVEPAYIEGVKITTADLAANFEETCCDNEYKIVGDFRLKYNGHVAAIGKLNYAYSEPAFEPICQLTYIHELQHVLRVLGVDSCLFI